MKRRLVCVVGVLWLSFICRTPIAHSQVPELPEALLLLPASIEAFELVNWSEADLDPKALRKAFEQSNPKTGLELVKRQYALEQMELWEHATLHLKAAAKGDALPEAPVEPAHQKSREHTEAFLTQHPEHQEARVLLALMVVADSGSTTGDALAWIEYLRVAELERYRTVLALALLRGSDEPDVRAAAWSVLETLPETHPHQGLVLLERVREAKRLRRPLRLEKALLQLFLHTQEHLDIQNLPKALRNELFGLLVDSGVQRPGGWIRTVEVLEMFEGAPYAELTLLARQSYAENKAPMHLAHIDLMRFREGLESDLGVVEAVIAHAETLQTAEAAALCNHAMTALSGRASEFVSEQSTLHAMARRCLDIDVGGPMSQSAMLELFETLNRHFADTFENTHHARFALLLAQADMPELAQDHIDAVDARALEQPLQQRFAVLAAQRLFAQMRIDLGAQDCNVLHATRATQSELHIAQLIELSESAELAASQRYERLNMRATLALKTGRYAEAMKDIEALLLAMDDGVPQRAMIDDIERFVACFQAAEQWPQLVALTRVIREDLTDAQRTPIQDRVGGALVSAHIAWAHTLHLAGDSKRAVSVLLELRKYWMVHPKEAEVLLATAELLDLTGQAQEALAYYTTLYELYPEHESADMALFASALILRDLDMAQEALPLLHKITEEYASGVYTTRALEEIDALERVLEE